MSPRLPAAILTVIACLASAAFPADGNMVVEMTVDDIVHVGQPVAHNNSVCWLASSDGAFCGIDLRDVTKFRKLSGTFHPDTPEQLAARLRQQWKRKFEVLVRGQYVICAPHGRAIPYAELMSRTDDNFKSYFLKRNVKLHRERFPLVVVVWATREEFDDSCRQDGMTPNPLIKGYYHPESNRVTLCDEHRSDVETASPETGGYRTVGYGRQPTVLVDASRNTAMHEAIHQLAFNSGLHSRIGQNPRWVVEGFATMLETGILQSEAAGGTGSRINEDRLKSYFDYRKTHSGSTIAEFVADDEGLFASTPLEAYGMAWALTFYLVEHRRSDYFRYLQRVAQRDPLLPGYSAADRLQDFQAVFGKDLRILEAQMTRYFDGHN